MAVRTRRAPTRFPSVLYRVVLVCPGPVSQEQRVHFPPFSLANIPTVFPAFLPFQFNITDYRWSCTTGRTTMSPVDASSWSVDVNRSSSIRADTPERPVAPRNLNPKSALRKVANISAALPLELDNTDRDSLLKIDPSILRPVRWVRFARKEFLNSIRYIVGPRGNDRHPSEVEDCGGDLENESEEMVEQRGLQPLPCGAGDAMQDEEHCSREDIARPGNPLATCRFLTADGDEILLGSNPALPSFGSFDSDDSDDDAESAQVGHKVQDVLARSLVFSSQEARALCSELAHSDTDTNPETRPLSYTSRSSSLSSLASLGRDLAYRKSIQTLLDRLTLALLTSICVFQWPSKTPTTR